MEKRSRVSLSRQPVTVLGTGLGSLKYYHCPDTLLCSRAAHSPKAACIFLAAPSARWHQAQQVNSRVTRPGPDERQGMDHISQALLLGTPPATPPKLLLTRSLRTGHPGEAWFCWAFCISSESPPQHQSARTQLSPCLCPTQLCSQSPRGYTHVLWMGALQMTCSLSFSSQGAFPSPAHDIGQSTREVYVHLISSRQEKEKTTGKTVICQDTSMLDPLYGTPAVSHHGRAINTQAQILLHWESLFCWLQEYVIKISRKGKQR